MRFFVFLILAAGLVVGVGFYRGWFTLTTGRVADNENKYNVKVEVDTNKIKSDTSAVKQNAREVGDSLSGAKTMHGTLVKIERDRFEVMDKDKQAVGFDLESMSKVRLQDRDVQLANLQVGDHVTVNYQDKDGKRLVRLVSAERAP